MTGQEFIEALTNQIKARGLLLGPYTLADLAKDAAEAGLGFRKPYAEEREEDINVARQDHAARQSGKVGGAQS